MHGHALHHPDMVEFKAVRYASMKQELHASLAVQEAEVLKDYSHLPVSFVRIHSKAALDKLLAQPGVAGVYENMVMHATLAESLPLIGQPQVAAQGNLGAGTTVAVLDTGVDYTRAAFGSCTAPGVPVGCKVVYAHDFAPDDGMLDDPAPAIGRHGTNVAGIVAGVAPGAKIVALDVFNGAGASSTDVIAAINWVISNKAIYNIVAINMSLGGGQYFSPITSGLYKTAVDQARAAGVLVVASSGNDGYTSSMESPAATAGVVSVGAVYDISSPGISQTWGSPTTCIETNVVADNVTCFSNGASFLTLLAPGAMITAAGITEGGTSQATPHVAGAVAVIRAAFPNESLDQTVARLTNGVMVTDSRNGITKPRLSLPLALGGGGVTPPTSDSQPPTIPTGLTATAISSTRIDLAWNASTDNVGVIAYKLYLNGTLLSTLGNVTSSTRSNFPSSTYSYSVSACDAAGNCSAQSSPAIATTLGTSDVMETGWWWNPAEGGRGFAIEKLGNKIFMAGFHYDNNGLPTWFTASGPMSGNIFSAPMQMYSGGQSLNSVYKSPTVTSSPGSISLNFSDTTHATMTWPGGSVPLQRFDITQQGSINLPAPSLFPERGWWWNPAEGGRGFALEIQCDNMFIAGFMYNTNGTPVWYVAQGKMYSPDFFMGPWNLYGGGQAMTGPYKSPSPIGSVGDMYFYFTDTKNGWLGMPNGDLVPMSRFTAF